MKILKKGKRMNKCCICGEENENVSAGIFADILPRYYDKKFNTCQKAIIFGYCCNPNDNNDYTLECAAFKDKLIFCVFKILNEYNSKIYKNFDQIQEKNEIKKELRNMEKKLRYRGLKLEKTHDKTNLENKSFYLQMKIIKLPENIKNKWFKEFELIRNKLPIR